VGTALNACGETDKAAINMLVAANFERIWYISLRGPSLHQECP
jgi:hypothetical protein